MRRRWWSWNVLALHLSLDPAHPHKLLNGLCKLGGSVGDATRDDLKVLSFVPQRLQSGAIGSVGTAEQRVVKLGLRGEGWGVRGGGG